MIAHDRLLKLISYNPLTGTFTCLVRRGRQSAGSVTGNIGNHGYIQLAIDKQMYLGHRLAFFYMTGRWPIEVDHKNGTKTDNRWTNLREATRSENSTNVARKAHNRSGFKGVSWHSSRGKWFAFIQKNGAQQFLGYFNDPVLAHEAYKNAAAILHGEFARAA